ncbi:MAG: polymer-forming cytoskeletal protein [candidate division WOR-3 bacterium]|nr:polymer-forming cytoskeletal protein [candidate division WOR-3 bacterium]
MFKKKDNNNNVDTILGSKGSFKGDILVEGGILIDGNVEGNVKTNSILIVGKEGHIIGDVWANELIVSGKIEGKVFVKNRIEVQSSGKIEGEIHCKILVVDEGGFVHGITDMKYQENE